MAIWSVGLLNPVKCFRKKFVISASLWEHFNHTFVNNMSEENTRPC